MKLQLKLFLLLSALVLAAAAVVNTDNYRQATRGIGRDIVLDQREKLEALALVSAPALVSGNDLALIDYAKIVKPLNPMAAWAEVIRENGEVVAHTDPGRIGAVEEIPPTEDILRHVYSKPVLHQGRAVGWVRMAVDPAKLEQAAEEARAAARGRAVRSFLVVAGLGLPVSFLISLAALLPLKRLLRGMHRLSEGDLGARLESGGRDEMGELAQQVNLLADMMSGARHEQEGMALKLAHDLKSPLAAIRSYLDLLAEKEPADAPVREDIETIKASAERLSRMIEDVLEKEKIIEGKAEPLFLAVDLSETLRRVHRMHRIEAERKGLNLMEPGLPFGMPEVLARPEHLERILDNLVTNAIKYTDAGGSVWIEVEVKVAEVWVMVNDTGMGIDASELPSLFQRFERGASPEVLERQGVGLGLFIARELTELQGGRIWAVSRGKGMGSTFVFTLKAVFDESALETESAGEES